MSFETDIVKVKKDDCTKDTTSTGELTPIVKCGGGGGASKYFAKNESDTDEYDYKVEDGDYIPCSQMRDVPRMLQHQNACCNFDDPPYQPMNLTHLDSPEENNSQDNDEGEFTDGNGMGDDSSNG